MKKTVLLAVAGLMSLPAHARIFDYETSVKCGIMSGVKTAGTFPDYPLSSETAEVKLPGSFTVGHGFANDVSRFGLGKVEISQDLEMLDANANRIVRPFKATIEVIKISETQKIARGVFEMYNAFTGKMETFTQDYPTHAKNSFLYMELHNFAPNEMRPVPQGKLVEQFLICPFSSLNLID